MNGQVTALAVSGTTLYAGGYFTSAGGTAANYVARWAGSAWSALGSGMDTYVSALAVSGGNLYAGGVFTTAGGGSANEIAQWDGSAWSALGSGMDGPVYALAVSGTDLYAGGAFTTAGGKVSSYAAKALLFATVAGRHVFYNASAWDGNDLAANPADDGAIAPDKDALLPGQTAVFRNYTSYSKGINGIMVDILALGGRTPSVSDFIFKVGNDNNPSAWSNAQVPSSIAVRAGAGVGGSDRITIIWANNAIQKQWLQVTVLATANTGLPVPDVFYFGNAIGECGNSAVNAQVDLADEIGARNNPRDFLHPAPITDPYDYNRNGRVDLADEIIARNNGTDFLTRLVLIHP
jgi:hypothetical protein